MNQSEKRISRSIFLGRRVRTYRERAGLTIAQLAALADVAPTTLAELERGKGNPRYETLCNLAAGLGIPITVLVQYEDMMLRDIYIESAKELLILFNELTDAERKKLSQLIIIFQRINSWKEKD